MWAIHTQKFALDALCADTILTRFSSLTLFSGTVPTGKDKRNAIVWLECSVAILLTCFCITHTHTQVLLPLVSSTETIRLSLMPEKVPPKVWISQSDIDSLGENFYCTDVLRKGKQLCLELLESSSKPAKKRYLFLHMVSGYYLCQTFLYIQDHSSY